ncbi:Do family serine endopeptidase [Enterobacteriaceae endosymbiont of Donacia semicuprea]|uniref:Do family serine endopeptidase n=1 Tax=Enterobacteriaceae endosymbiont of Donacia semicuprea TaxID=2675783 RepID=UPI001448F0AF|nr:Do family serine endopeptidase [Enterobacteriaceae endosymbiont of Donacia semicuprea]QJC32867.1 Do family serine endopeptidase [Enterobacteriaceae endosymbiont of Donacia semicuprea]
MKKIKIIFCLLFFVYILITITTPKNVNAKLLPNFTKKLNNNLPSLAPILAKVIPSVVNIDVQGSTFTSEYKLPKQVEQYLREHFLLCKDGSPYENTLICGNSDNILEQRFHSIGSGVIINAKKGLIITNNHVIDHANYISVELNNGKTYEAQIIGRDSKTDIALIKIMGKTNNLKSLKIANSDTLKVGDYTIAIGNPYALGETVTSGIISGLGRSGLHIENFENFIQTDAAINFGSSGGALVNLNGDLIGINTAILAPNEGNIGIGFAIPINTVMNLVNQFIKFGKIKRGSLGINGIDFEPELAKILQIPYINKGVFVREIIKLSKDNELQAGDVIISLNGKNIDSYSLLKAKISSFVRGTVVKLGIIRKRIFKIVNVKIKDYNNDNISKNIIYNGIEGVYLNNIKLKNKIYFFKKIQKTSVQVNKVLKNSPAEKIGLKKGDIIIAINERIIKNVNDVKKVLNKKQSLILLHILRGKRNLYLIN